MYNHFININFVIVMMKLSSVKCDHLNDMISYTFVVIDVVD